MYRNLSYVKKYPFALIRLNDCCVMPRKEAICPKVTL